METNNMQDDWKYNETITKFTSSKLFRLCKNKMRIA